MKKEEEQTEALPTEVTDENGEKISLVDKDGDPIDALSFLARQSNGKTVTENDRLLIKVKKYRVMSLCFFLAFLCFLCLFVVTQNKYNEKCQEMFNDSLSNSISLLSDCIDSDFDYDTKFRELTAELNIVRKMSFSVTDDKEKCTTYNEIYSLSIKLPEEFKKYIRDIKDGFDYINSGYSEKGFAILDSVINKTDMLNY